MSIIIKPIITEKATTASELNNCYSFLVNTKANKVEIKKAVEKVRTMNYGPERKTKFTKTGVQQGKTNAIKKAIVKVAEGDAIDFYNNI